MQTRYFRWAALAAAAAAALTLSACASTGGDSGGTEHGGHRSEAANAPAASEEHGHGEAAPAAFEAASEVAVTASAFRFEPRQLTVTAGQPVNIVLTSTDMVHDFVVDGQDFHLAADANQTVVGGLKIDEPGTYTVYCSVAGHREAGMQATLTVQRA